MRKLIASLTVVGLLFLAACTPLENEWEAAPGNSAYVANGSGNVRLVTHVYGTRSVGGGTTVFNVAQAIAPRFGCLRVNNAVYKPGTFDLYIKLGAGKSTIRTC